MGSPTVPKMRMLVRLQAQHIQGRAGEAHRAGEAPPRACKQQVGRLLAGVLRARAALPAVRTQPLSIARHTRAVAARTRVQLHNSNSRWAAGSFFCILHPLLASRPTWATRPTDQHECIIIMSTAASLVLLYPLVSLGHERADGGGGGVEHGALRLGEAGDTRRAG